MNGERDFEVVHGTALALGEKAVLIRGQSGAGKSDLALRCIALPALAHIPHRAELVSDDQVRLRNVEGAVEVSAPETIAGLLEVRSLGVLTMPYRPRARLALVIDLVPSGEVSRYPLDTTSVEYLSVELPLLRLAAFESSCPIKVILALHAA